MPANGCCPSTQGAKPRWNHQELPVARHQSCKKAWYSICYMVGIKILTPGLKSSNAILHKNVIYRKWRVQLVGWSLLAFSPESSAGSSSTVGRLLATGLTAPEVARLAPPWPMIPPDWESGLSLPELGTNSWSSCCRDPLRALQFGQ